MTDASALMRKGYCLCGQVRFALFGEANWIGHCHCESCRRPTASPMTTWIGQPNGAWEWHGGLPKIYASSAGVERGFCGTCGRPVSYFPTEYPDETHFYAALLEITETVRPTVQYHRSAELGWMRDAANLPDG